MKLTRLAVLLATALCLAGTAARGEDAQTLEVAVSKTVNVKLRLPAEWVKKASTVAKDGSATLVLCPASGPGHSMTLFLNFSIDTQSKLVTQEAVNELVTGELAGKESPLVVMKSKSGLGAYAFTLTPAGGPYRVPASATVYNKTGVAGAFVTAGVVEKFIIFGLGGTEFEQALKFIEEGITVEGGK